MNYLWLAWKDKKHPLAGGAEMVNEELAKRLVRDGHKVIFLTAGFKGGAEEEIVDGYRIIRLGSRWTVYWKAFRYYKKNLRNWADLIIDEINTIPFFAKYYESKVHKVIKSKVTPSLDKGRLGGVCNNKEELPTLQTLQTNNLLFIHQLCREIWFYQIFFPLNLIGYLLEPVYLRLLNDRLVITVSESTKLDLLKYGFRKENIKIISEGIELEPVTCHSRENGNPFPLKYESPSLLCFGSVRAMKRTDHIVKAFEIAKDKIPDLKLIIAGDYNNNFGGKVYNLARQSKHSASIEFLGKVSCAKKTELLRKSHLLCAASIKEGWGLVVTEANSQGTPAIVYGADGLRDSVRHNDTGIVCEKNTPENMAENIISLLKDREKYDKMRFNAWQWSKEITFDRSYRDFISALTL